MRSGAGNLLFGVVLLLAGVGFTVASENVVWYGAIAVGLINIVRGAMKLSREREDAAPARLAGEDAPAKPAGDEGAPKSIGTAEAEPPPVLDMKDLGTTAGWLLAFAIPAAFFFLLPPLTKSGLWDPYELNVADLGRRLALNLFHADSLLLSGADNSLPHLNDLGRPELPFTSMALGFRLFGLHEWAGRLPLAIWGLAGAIATFGWVARLVDRRAGVFASVVLCTMPLYFVQARTMLGDVVTMSAISMAFGGLVVGAFGRGDKKVVDAGRVAWTVLGLAALVAGYYSRGLLLGVGAPAVAVGLAWLATWGTGTRRLEPFGDIVGLVALVVGGWAATKGILACSSTEVSNDLNMAAGAVLHAPQKYPTFDYFIGHLGPAAAPWSALVPLAMGRMFVSPVGRTGVAHEREGYARLAILVGGAVAFVAHGWLAARTDLIPFTAPALLAASCGIALRDYERGAKPSIALAVVTMVFLGVFHHDFHELPEKAYQAFGINGAPFPESYKVQALALWTAALIGFAILAMLTWVERDPKRKPFDPQSYVAILRGLREAWDGLLSLAYFALVAGASLAGLIVWIGVRAKMNWVGAISLQTRDVILNLWWITAFVPLAIILGIFFALDVWLWAFGGARPLGKGSFSRGFEPFEELFGRVRERFADKSASPWSDPAFLVSVFALSPFMVLALPAGIFGYLATHGVRTLIALALAIPSSIALFLALGVLGDVAKGRRSTGFAMLTGALGLVLSVGYFPALANQLSPKEVFESYQREHKPGEPLALFGVGGRTAAYYAGGQPETLPDTQHAFTWLMEGSANGQRRFLATRADELARLNQLYRMRTQPPSNLPVLDARSSQIMLVASALGPDEKNQNPLGRILLSSEPTGMQHTLNVNMEDKLMVLGFDLTDANGKLVESVAPGRKYHMKTYYKVLAPVTTEWEGFIHIDGYRRRHNGDHKPMDGKYPFSLWLKGDILLDDHEFALEPNFSPGQYTIFFGLFVGDTRMKIVSGPNDGDNRINGGPLKVQ